MLNLKSIKKLPILFIMVCAFFFSANTFAQRVIEIKGVDQMKFSVESITAKPGEKLTVKLYVDTKLPPAAMSHNFVLLKKGVDLRAYAMASAKHKDNDYLDPSKQDQVIAATKMGTGGQTVEVTFDAPTEPGDYEYVCTFPGHFMKMKGILTVK